MQGVLEYLQIPYTHSGVMASALAMDKERSKIIAAHAGVEVAQSLVMSRYAIGADHPMPPPYVIKPLREGSSFGVVIVREGQESPPQMVRSDEWRYGEMVMVERFTWGELTCAVMGDQSGTGRPGYAFYDYDLKYKPGGPNTSSAEATLFTKKTNNVLKAHRQSVAAEFRSDFRFDDRHPEEGEVIWLESIRSRA